MIRNLLLSSLIGTALAVSACGGPATGSAPSAQPTTVPTPIPTASPTVLLPTALPPTALPPTATLPTATQMPTSAAATLAATMTSAPATVTQVPATATVPPATPTPEPPAATPTRHPNAIFRLVKPDGTVHDFLLADLRALPLATIMMDGSPQEGPTLLSVLEAAGVTTFEQVLVEGDRGDGSLSFTRDQVTPAMLLDFANRGTVKIAAPTLPRPSPVRDVRTITVK